MREKLEILPEIESGNPYATILAADVAVSDVLVTVVNNAGVLATAPYYIQLDEEICKVTAVGAPSGGNRVLTVERARLYTTASAHNGTSDPAGVHILGDIGVAREAIGGTYVYTLSFLTNYYTGTNNWGTREVDLVATTIGNPDSLATMVVEKKVNGAGYGIQQIAKNNRTIVKTYEQDFYLNADELPSLFGVDIIVKAANTF
jgi:hypothetical protein